MSAEYSAASLASISAWLKMIQLYDLVLFFLFFLFRKSFITFFGHLFFETFSCPKVILVLVDDDTVF